MNITEHNKRMYNAYVHEYRQKFMDLKLYKDSFNYFLERLPPDANILDLGCGPGNVITYLKSKRPDIHFVGVDIAGEMVAAARMDNPSEEFMLMDIRDAARINRRFDAVIAAFVIPYMDIQLLPDFFAAVKSLLAANGTFYISCMEASVTTCKLEKTSFTSNDKVYISYLKRADIESLIHQYGFESLQLQTIDYPELDGSVTKELVYTTTKVSETSSPSANR